MSSTLSSPAKPEGDVPDLRSLGPQYDEKLHGRHANVLLKVLSDGSVNAPRNIALAGHYGSGKSSVILGVQKGLDEKKVQWVNLSLSSLGIDDTKRARVQADGTLAPLTNLIQKEIVKQLLYRKAPRDMPGSRYFRIDSFRTWRAAQWAAATTIGVFVTAVLLGLVDRVEKVGPKWLVDGPTWAPWLAVGLVGAFMGAVCFLALRGLQNPVKLDSVSAGGAAVSLSAKENSYFDEYLDEIVYFFQQTKTTVAIFEDLDRFKDPHIFETLRELNTVLNHSEQVKAQPVRFIYAVRDSIFEQLKIDPANDDPDAESASEGSPAPRPSSLSSHDERSGRGPMRAAAQESTPSSNRTKFFDMVVPMVPFLTHRSARDLLTAEFENSIEKPSTALVNLVGAHQPLTDMRLILNIRNEFEIYRPSVLGKDGLEGLTADRLFAMMVYKNTHLEDFEAIRHGTSQIDAAYQAFRDIVEHQVAFQSARSRRALAKAQGVQPWDKAAQAVGERLAEVLPLLHRANPRGGRAEPQFITSSGTYTMADLVSGALWKELHEGRKSIQLGHPSYGTTTVSFDELLLLAGETGLALESAVKTDVAEMRRQSRAALDVKEFITKATLAQAMARTDLTMADENGDERNLDEIVSATVTPLARDLLAFGYIDENYTLYCSDYHGVAISVSAMNFILHAVQDGQSYPLFRFDAPSSIDAVENEMGERFLGSDSVFNVEVFDHYLTKADGRLDGALNRLAVDAAAGDTSFLDLFLEDVDVTTKNGLISELTPRWAGMFVHLADRGSTDEAISLVDTAIRSSARDVDYETSDSLTQLIEENYPRIGAFTEPVTEAQADDLMHLLRELDVSVAALAELGQAQRQAVIAGGLYPVTRNNLMTALGEQDGVEADLALDAVRASSDVVYRHVIENLHSYLDALKSDEVTVADAGAYIGVLADIAEAPEQMLQWVAQRASTPCIVTDLSELDQVAWPAVVSVDRLRMSVSNVNLFVHELGVTPEIGKRLAEHDLAEADEVEEDAREAVAYAIIESMHLNAVDQVRLVKQLKLSGYLDPSKFGSNGLSLIPDLLAAGEVNDDEDVYAFIADRPYAFRESFFTASESLATYVTKLSLSSDDLAQMVSSRRIAPEVKRAVAADADFVAARLSQKAVIAFCQWADLGEGVSVDLLLVLVRAGAPATRALTLLEPLLPDINSDTLDEILGVLGEEYELLTRLGHHRPLLKSHPGTEALLDELRKRGRVSTYGQVPLVGRFRVNMRR